MNRFTTACSNAETLKKSPVRIPAQSLDASGMSSVTHPFFRGSNPASGMLRTSPESLDSRTGLPGCLATHRGFLRTKRKRRYITSDLVLEIADGSPPAFTADRPFPSAAQQLLIFPPPARQGQQSEAASHRRFHSSNSGCSAGPRGRLFSSPGRYGGGIGFLIVWLESLVPYLTRTLRQSRHCSALRAAHDVLDSLAKLLPGSSPMPGVFVAERFSGASLFLFPRYLRNRLTLHRRRASEALRGFACLVNSGMSRLLLHVVSGTPHVPLFRAHAISRFRKSAYRMCSVTSRQLMSLRLPSSVLLEGSSAARCDPRPPRLFRRFSGDGDGFQAGTTKDV